MILLLYRRRSPPTNTEYFRAEKVINGKTRSISVVFGDIVKESGAIVNAASNSIEGGGGIDGAIHDAALENGKDVLKEEAIQYKQLHKISSLPTGSAMVAHSYGLPKAITMVVQTVGPNLSKGTQPTEKQKIELYSAIYNSLLKASEFDAKSISIPAISGGLFYFPLDIAAELYMKAALQFLNDHNDSSIEPIRFTNFDNVDDAKTDKNPTVRRIAEAFMKVFP